MEKFFWVRTSQLILYFWLKMNTHSLEASFIFLSLKLLGKLEFYLGKHCFPITFTNKRAEKHANNVYHNKSYVNNENKLS